VARKEGKEMTEKEKVYFTSAELILGAQDLREDDVHVLEWRDMGAEWVRIRELTAGDRDYMESSMISDAQKEGEEGAEVTLKGKAGQSIAADNFRSKIVALSVIHPETKEHLFTINQIKQLATKSATAIARIADAAVALNKMSREEVERLGEEFETVKVSVASSTDSSEPESVEEPSESSTEESVPES
jgi:hypothetical protein